MNIQVIWGTTDITSETVDYERTGKICSGVSNCTVTVAYTGREFNPYDSIIIYEGGIKKGTYFITSITRNVNSNTVILETQDSTKQLNDYYIPESYEITSPTYAKYWIEKFLTEAGVSYEFDVEGDGSILNNQDVLGMQYAIEVLTKLVQISGWYFHADSDNVIHIGKLAKNPSNYKFYLRPTEIINFIFHKDDKMLRNRSVVWGATNPATQQWAFADVRVRTGYETSSQDWRSTLVVNTHIENKATAYAIANKFLKEMRNATEIKTVTCAGYYDFSLGDTIFVQDKKFNGNALITSYIVSATSSGFTTTFILDERCPRMFGYYAYDGYVYASTLGAGVWRKPLNYTHVWEDFSSGLTDLNIVDLSINNGIYACVSASGILYTRTSIDSVWTPFVHSGFYNYVTGEPVSGVVSTSCSVDKFNNHVYATYAAMSGVTLLNPTPSISGTLGGSWLVDIYSVYPKSYSTLPIILDNVYPSGYVPPSGYNVPSGEFRVGALDVDNNGVTQYVSAFTQGNSIKIVNPTLGSFGDAVVQERDASHVQTYIDNTHYSFLPQADSNGKVVITFEGTEANNLVVGVASRYSSFLAPVVHVRTSSDIPVYSGMLDFEWLDTTTRYCNTSPFYDITYPEDPYWSQNEHIINFSALGHHLCSWKNVDYYKSIFVQIDSSAHTAIFYLLEFDTVNKTYSSSTIMSFTDVHSIATHLFDRQFGTAGIKFVNGHLCFYFPLNSSSNTYRFVNYAEASNTYVTKDIDVSSRYYVEGTNPYNYRMSKFFDNGDDVYSYYITKTDRTFILHKMYFSGFTDYTVGNLYTSPSSYLEGIDAQLVFELMGGDKVTGEVSVRVYGRLTYKTEPFDAVNLTFVGNAEKPETYQAFPYGTAVDTIDYYLYSCFLSNRFLSKDATAEKIKIVDADDLSVIAYITWPKDINNVLIPITAVCASIDDADDSIYIQFLDTELRGYDATTGELKKQFYYLSGGTEYNYEIGIQDIIGNAVFYTTSSQLILDSFYPAEQIIYRIENAYYRILKKIGNLFHQNAIAFPYPPEVESSLTFPIAVHGGVVVSGIGTGLNYGYLYVSPMGDDNTYSIIRPADWQNTVISDVRSVDIDDGTDGSLRTYVVFPQITASGSVLSYYDATDLPYNSSLITASGVTSSGITNKFTFSGYANHLEFTNYATYEFVSLSGVPTTFYQRQRDAISVAEQSFIDRSTGFPDAEITQIRCDDSL